MALLLKQLLYILAAAGAEAGQEGRSHFRFKTFTSPYNCLKLEHELSTSESDLRPAANTVGDARAQTGREVSWGTEDGALQTSTIMCVCAHHVSS